jgi:tetratricopeptide (TPR) repeat protein
MRTRVLSSLAVLALLWFALPVKLANSSGGTSAECLTLPDAPPDPKRADIIPVLERCSALHPIDVELMADLGSVYESAGRLPDAETIYRRALSIDAGYADVRLRLGRLLLNRGDGPAARREAETALRTQPNRKAALDLIRDAQAAERARR